MLPQRLPSDNPSHMLAQLEAAILGRDQATVHSILEQLDLLSANECLRQLGEEWGFPTVEVYGRRLMAGRDLARLVYDVDNPANVHRMLARFGRKPLYLQSYNQYSKVNIRHALGIHTHATSVSLVTWADVVIVGMRGHTAGAKRLQAYLLKAERENRLHWTMEQLQAGAGELLQRAVGHMSRRTQVNWSKKRNDLLFGQGGWRFHRSWAQTHVAHTGKTGKEWRAIGKTKGIKDAKQHGERLSTLKVIRAEMPEAAASISAESEYMVRGITQPHAERLAVTYIQPLSRELKALGYRMQEELDFARDLEEGL